MGLILLFTLPALKAMESNVPLGIFDYFLSIIFIAFVIMEYIADNQQYHYHDSDIVDYLQYIP